MDGSSICYLVKTTLTILGKFAAKLRVKVLSRGIFQVKILDQVMETIFISMKPQIICLIMLMPKAEIIVPEADFPEIFETLNSKVALNQWKLTQRLGILKTLI